VLGVPAELEDLLPVLEMVFPVHTRVPTQVWGLMSSKAATKALHKGKAKEANRTCSGKRKCSRVLKLV
jgi:hypothetical protein